MNKKTLFSILACLIGLNLFAQNDVELTTTGIGIDSESSKNSALRSAIEQAYGVFLSSNTVIKNDELLKDEIISLSSGNIKKFDILSQFKMPDNKWSTTLKCIVSVNTLNNYCKSKGMQTTFDGNLFAFNISQKDLFKKNQEKILNELYILAEKLIPNMFDYEIQAIEPVKFTYGHSSRISGRGGPIALEDKYTLPLKVNCKVNSNYNNLYKTIISTLKNITIKEAALADYKTAKIDVFAIGLSSSEKSTFLKNINFNKDRYNQRVVTTQDILDVDGTIINFLSTEDCDTDARWKKQIMFSDGESAEYGRFVTDNYFSADSYKITELYFASKKIFKFIQDLDNLVEKTLLSNYEIKNKEVLLGGDPWTSNGFYGQENIHITPCLHFGAYVIDCIRSRSEGSIIRPANMEGNGEAIKLHRDFDGNDEYWKQGKVMRTDINDFGRNKKDNVNFYNLKEGSLVGIFYIGYYFSLNEIKNISNLTISPKH